MSPNTEDDLSENLKLKPNELQYNKYCKSARYTVVGALPILP